MLHSIIGALGNSKFLPHGYCLSWDPLLLWSLVGSHAVIGLAYYSIPITLLVFLKRQPNLKFNWVFALFGLFIFACGTTHFISILDIWLPVYRIDAAATVVTAAISAVTALAVWPLVPQASAFLSARELERQKLHAANQNLGDSVELLNRRRGQIEASERRFRLTLETAPIGCAIVGLDGRWITVNQALCAMFGYSEEELLALTFQDLTHPDDLDRDLDEVKNLLEARGDTYRMEKRYIVKQGREIRTQLDVAILRDELGQPIQFISQIQDITARKQIEQDLHDSKTQLESGFALLSQQNREITLLGELSATIQACQSLDEIAAPIAGFGCELFPGYGGALYLIRDSGNFLESVAEWGSPIFSDDSLALDACWALRRGQSHRGDDKDGLRCQHIRRIDAGAQLICVPMSAQGETLGLLYLQAAAGGRAAAHSDTHLEQLSAMVADRLGIALANIRLRQTLRQQSIRDPLTRLFNRRYLAESLPRELSVAEREGLPLAVLMFDVDRFKRFNDAYGHDLGDQVLRMIGDVLFDQFRGSDIACRYGGEEFAVVLTRTNLRQAVAKAEELRANVRRLEITHRHQAIGPISISIGIAGYPQHGTTAAALIAAADDAMYAAKRAGRDCVVCRGDVAAAVVTATST
ncbi:MAG: hypothetical protein JWR16_506 [Nevskia sp.]|nr:hypothetical protein [Nevskia sp.]